MKNKYIKCGLNYELIIESFPDLEEYEKTLHLYLEDEFFKDLNRLIEEEDYALAKDAVKGLYILASELKLFPLYQALLDVYEDLEVEFYQDVLRHYEEMMEVHRSIREAFSC